MKEVNASIITIGDELLIGQTIDTNSAYIGTELNKIGIWVKRRVAVGDDKQDILKALEMESQDCQIIIITGGLGPTADDITKPALCEYFNASLVVNEEALKNVKEIFEKLKKPLLERNLKQAEIPDNCEALQNRRGTAPGMWFNQNDVIYISLPGVPREMKGIFEQDVITRLTQNFELPAIIHKTLVTAGKGESELAEMIVSFEEKLPTHIKLAYLPNYGMVRLRLTAKGKEKTELQTELEEQVLRLKQLIEPWIVTDEDISLPQVLLELLKNKKQTFGTAESCTGGYIAHLITSIAGSSAVYKGSVVAYANEIKERILRLHKGTLSAAGAVSEETVKQMATGALNELNTDYVIATSGIMGPEGGSPEKPVGTVWIAVASRKEVQTQMFSFRFNRSRNIELTAHSALNMLRKLVLKEGLTTD